MRKYFAVSILTLFLVYGFSGCPVSPPPELGSVPMMTIWVNSQMSVDLSPYVSSNFGQLIWLADGVDSNLLEVWFSGNLMTMAAGDWTGFTSFTLTVTDALGQTDSAEVYVEVIGGSEGEGEGEGEGEPGEGEGEGEIYYTLQTAVLPFGSGTISPAGGGYFWGQQIFLTAIANYGWHFDHWIGNVADEYSSQTTITMYQDEAVTAVFFQDQAVNYTLTVNTSGSGSVSLSSGTYPEGTQVTIKATANYGWHFDHWIGNVADEYSSQTTITMYQDETVTAVFLEDEVVACKIHGLNFSPFVEVGQNPDLGSTVSQEQVNRLVDIVAPRTDWLRTYGSLSGNQYAPPRAKAHGLSVAVGAWIGSNAAANDQEIAAAISLANQGYADLVIVGTEVLLRGNQTATQLIEYINYVKSQVFVPVATAEIPSYLLDNPEVMAASDIILVDIYPFWEAIAIDQAVKHLNSSYAAVSAAAGGKQVIVAETGWPSGGSPVGSAVPSPDNAAYYFLNFVSWAKAEGVDYFYFEAFNEPWKITNEGDVGDDWGIYTSDGVLKPGRQAVFDCETVADNWSVCEPGSPLFELTYVPAIGSSEFLRGQVCGIDFPNYAVAVYIYASGWWNKPYYGQELTFLEALGSWSCDIVTGGHDSSATQIAAFLVPDTYSPPILGGEALIPQSIYNDALAYLVVDR